MTTMTSHCVHCDQPMNAWHLLKQLVWSWDQTYVDAFDLHDKCLVCYYIEFHLQATIANRIHIAVRGKPISDEEQNIALRDLEEVYQGKYVQRDDGTHQPMGDPGPIEWTPHDCELRKTGVVVPLEKRPGLKTALSGNWIVPVK